LKGGDTFNLQDIIKQIGEQ